MKRCSRCGESRSVEEFGFKDARRIQLRSHCRICSRELIRDHYRRNTPYYIAKSMARKRPQLDRIHGRVLDYLRAHPCVDCGESDPSVLDFDHLDPRQKSREVGKMINNGFGWATIQAEIAKCAVRCANCHRRRTARQFGWYRAEPAWGATRGAPGET